MPLDLDPNLLGCGAKISAGDLRELVDASDDGFLAQDAGLVGGFRVCVDTVLPFTFDVVDFARGALLHCFNDLICCGVEPEAVAIAIGLGVGIDSVEAKKLVRSLFGFLDESGVVVANAHTFRASECSITVTAMGRERGQLRIDPSAKHALVLTDPIGASLSNEMALMRGEKALKPLCLNRLVLADSFRAYARVGSTDISGFGLAGHLVGLAAGMGWDIDVWPLRVKYEADLADRSDLDQSCSVRQNFRSFGSRIELDPGVDRWRLDALFAGETNGPLLAVVPVQDVEVFREACVANGWHESCVVGEVSAGRGTVRAAYV